MNLNLFTFSIFNFQFSIIMVQFWITLQKLVQYNIKIIFGNKFLYFMLSALAFYVITVIVKLLGDDEITQATAYSMLMLPSILLVFYPMCFGIQNDQDAKIVEIIFGIPNYSYKVWLLRLIISCRPAPRSFPSAPISKK